METYVLVITIAVCVSTLILGGNLWLLFESRKELLELRIEVKGFQDTSTKQNTKLVNQLTELNKELAALKETALLVQKTFHDAEGSFKHMIDSLEAVQNFQEIKERADQITDYLVTANQKIQSQVETTGQVIHSLHNLVTQWSTEGSELQKAYVTLANCVSQTLAQDLERRDQLNLKLETLLVAHNFNGRSSHASQ